MTQIYAVRVGKKYGIEFEDYINSKFPEGAAKGPLFQGHLRKLGQERQPAFE